MILIGDIGNTDTKICLINSNYKIIKKLVLPTQKINNSLLFQNLYFIIKKKINIKKSLFQLELQELVGQQQKFVFLEVLMFIFVI